MEVGHEDIKPETEIASLRRDFSPNEGERTFDIELVSALAGMSPAFVRKVLGSRSKSVTLVEVLVLLDQDAFHETFVPRSRIPDYLLSQETDAAQLDSLTLNDEHTLICGNTKELVRRIPRDSVRCVVTSSPYWAMRIYDLHYLVEWADGEKCPYGHEQTPEGFVRHTVELLYLLKPTMKVDGSIWWNLMDTYNTRTQIRNNASETLRAMRGLDGRGWKDYTCRRYSAGHSYLQDGEQCLIPGRVAERASRIGYWVKSQISWKKEGSLPETVGTRVTREAEYILHLTLQRSPFFDKDAYRELPSRLGGRNRKYEFDKVTDVWCLPTASGKDGHGAQFPLGLPGRCIGLTSQPGDLILDPFVGSGTTSVAARELGRRSLGFDVNEDYLATARRRLANGLQPGLNFGSGSQIPDEAPEEALSCSDV
jgi:DNA modification methylase